MSLVLRPGISTRVAPRMTQTAAVGVAKALRGFGVEARIKWPNDLLVDGRKICGMLAESSVENVPVAAKPVGPGAERPVDFVVLGVGLNANVDPQDLGVPDREVATLRSELGRDVDLLELLESLLSHLDAELGRIKNLGAILGEWRALNCTLGERVRVRRLGEVLEGVALDLGPEGELLLKTHDGVIELFEGADAGPRPPNAWAGLAAWAWGASRALDYFKTELRIDSTRIAVVGHSRGGKAALWAGAEDERIALVISNESGEGGAALTRRNFGETLPRITETFPHWFATNYRSFAGKESTLPIDQHMLLALTAPRALYVASADEDLWSDPRGEFLSLAHASPVFALWKDPAIRADDMPPLERPLAVGRRGYHIRTGPHNLTPYDWERFLDFAESLGWN